MIPPGWMKSKAFMPLLSLLFLLMISIIIFYWYFTMKQPKYNYSPAQVVDQFFKAAIAGDAKMMVALSIDPCINNNGERIRMFKSDIFSFDPITAYSVISSAKINPATEEYVVRFTAKSSPQLGDIPYRVVLLDDEWKLLFERFEINGIPGSPDYGKVSRLRGCEARETIIDQITNKIKSYF